MRKDYKKPQIKSVNMDAEMPIICISGEPVGLGIDGGGILNGMTE